MSVGGPDSLLYPQVTSVPGGGEKPSKGSEEAKQSLKEQKDFQSILDNVKARSAPTQELGQVQQPVQFSGHATQRLQERNIEMGPEMMQRVQKAVNQAGAKGVEDTLVLTDEAAFVVNVPNRTVVTAMERGSLSQNVFTNIDGAVVV